VRLATAAGGLSAACRGAAEAIREASRARAERRLRWVHPAALLLFGAAAFADLSAVMAALQAGRAAVGLW
jgi:hypothetical protein